jgi:acetyl esterase/lipase
MLTAAIAAITIRLWDGDAPYATGKEDKDIPILTEFLPKKPSKTAIVVCPGGAYAMLADHEGKDYAEYLALNGITAYVLCYRLGQSGYRHPAMLADAQRAIRKVRSLGYTTVGIMGSSAGGHLAGTAAVHHALKTYEPDKEVALEAGPKISPVDSRSPRPDFAILCYAVTSFDKPFGHEYSGKMLLGEKPNRRLMDLMNLPKHVNKDTSPTFLWHTQEDTGVPPQNSELFAAALRKAGVECEYHVFQKGAHGIGLADKAPYKNAHPWAGNLLYWLRQHGWAPK